MSTINMTDWIKSILQNKQVLAIPIMTHPGIELIGQQVKQAVTDGQVHFEAIKVLYNNYPAAAATVIMDLTVEAEAFGSTIRFPEDEVPAVTDRLVSDYESVSNLAIPSITSGRIPEYLKANRLAADYIQDKPVFAGCIGPYSLAGRLFDMSEIMIAIYTEPETASLLLDKCTTFITEYCRALKATGVNGVIIAEPAAGLLSDDDCEQHSSTYVKKIIAAVQDDSFAVILHNCGNTGHCTKAMLHAGAAGYHFGNKIDMTEVANTCPPDVLLLGNLDPVSIFQTSTPEEVKAATLQLLTQMKGHTNFILSSGCDTPPNVPFENIDMFYKTLHDFNNQ